MPEQKRMNAGELSELYQGILHLNREAFEGGVYDASYHLLMAALHCAQKLSDTQKLNEVGQLAKTQLEWIDAHAPEYEHSTAASSQRGHPNIYQNLISQTRARQAFLHSVSKS